MLRSTCILHEVTFNIKLFYMIDTDICIIGAGPVGLFAVFEAGLLKLRCHLVDYLPQPGGQLSEIYPKKPIYDIPGFPTINAQELVDNLLEQGKPFNPTFTLGERVESINKLEDGSFELTTHLDTKIHAKIICIAGGWEYLSLENRLSRTFRRMRKMALNIWCWILKNSVTRNW